MNTRIDVVLCDRTEDDLKYIIRLIYDKIKSIEKIGNYFDPESEISIVNKAALYVSISISPELYMIISEALYYNKLTYGYFDVTIHSENYSENSISHIMLEKDKSAIYFTQDGLRIDLSGFLKGYALDKVLSILNEHKIINALLNVGNSSVMALGNHPFGEGWKIGFEDYRGSAMIHLKDQCLTTSGNNCRERKHIVNPYNNSFIEGTKQISVITQNGIEGEVLSTTLFAAPEVERGNIMKNFKATIQNTN